MYMQKRMYLTYPWREHRKVEEDSCPPHIDGETAQLCDGLEGSEGLVHGDGQLGIAILQLFLNVMRLTITCSNRQIHQWKNSVRNPIYQPRFLAALKMGLVSTVFAYAT